MMKEKELKTKVEEFIKFLETKLWNLHREEQGWRKTYQRKLRKLQVESMAWNQQIGKMVFISAILREFFNRPGVPNKVWKERKWKLSEDRNRIIKDRKKRKK